jgi:CubicO group peptidase (beta-lactamase class C family)
LKLVATWGGGIVSTRAMAAVGRLLVNKGSWNGEQLICAEVVEKALEKMPQQSDAQSRVSCGFWLNGETEGKARWSALPGDAAMAAGANTQILLFSPSQKLIVVRFGTANLEPNKYAEDTVHRYIGIPLENARDKPSAGTNP